MFPEVDCGLRYRFRYPRHNYRGVRRDLDARRVLVEEVRRLDQQPLELVTLELDPLLERGRVLVTGIDLDKMARRSFYLESMADIEHDSGPDENQRHRVYVFDPSGEVPPLLAFASDEISQAMVWVAQWERDHQGHVAVLWPVGAAPPMSVRPREKVA